MDHDAGMRMLRVIAVGFDTHDLEAIMAHFTDDAVYESPRGPDPWGMRFVGKQAVRDGFAARFRGIPDVRYQGDDRRSGPRRSRGNRAKPGRHLKPRTG